MAERLITVETRLKPNTDLTNYLNFAVIVYEQAKREICHQMTNPNYNTKYSKESESSYLIKFLMLIMYIVYFYIHSR